MQVAITRLSLEACTTALPHVRARFLVNPQLLTRG
jgi:hypothetical protein